MDFGSLGTMGVLVALVIDRMWKGYGSYLSNKRTKEFIKSKGGNPGHSHNHNDEGTLNGNLLTKNILSKINTFETQLKAFTNSNVCDERKRQIETIATDFKVLGSKMNKIAVDVGTIKGKLQIGG